ncbi:putative spanin [Erwinia phage Snitter]|nr:putative spanin [Erwinia phage Snitter]
MKLATVILIAAIALTGCSGGLGSLAGLVGSKPEVTAQVGAENVKQGVGLSSKVDASSEVKNDLKNSKVESLDTSNGKKVSASSISAGTITADRIEIRNNDSPLWVEIAAGVICLLLLLILVWINRSKKAP